MRRAFVVIVLAWALAVPRLALADAIEELATALQIDALLQIVRDEGVVKSADVLPRTSSGDVVETAMQEAIEAFDLEQMQLDMRRAFAAHLDEAMLTQAIAFFESDAGRAVINMELSARRAIIDPAIEEAARATWEEQRDGEDAHVKAIKSFERANDLIARNAAGAMVARYEFLLGMARGSGEALNEDAALADVWARERRIVEDTESWLMGYLLLAYGPLSTEYIDAYTAFSREPAGRALNAALFDGFDESYRRISFELGRINGQAASAKDL